MLGTLGGGLVGLLVGVAGIYGAYKTFEKAGQPGILCLVPIVNLIILLRIAAKPLWWLLLLLIPVVNLLIGFVVMVNIAQRFGKSALFGVGLLLLAPVFWFLLGTSDATYRASA
jgi:hypothetical protein